MENWNCKRLEFTILSVSENMKPVKKIKNKSQNYILLTLISSKSDHLFGSGRQEAQMKTKGGIYGGSVRGRGGEHEHADNRFRWRQMIGCGDPEKHSPKEIEKKITLKAVLFALLHFFPLKK